MIFINDYHNRIVKLSNFNESYEVIAPFTRLIEAITKNFLGKHTKHQRIWFEKIIQRILATEKLGRAIEFQF